MINNFRKGRAFTLIELIIVIAILGVLVLLAAPRFLGYTEDAKVVQIKNDVKVVENALEIELIDDPEYMVNEGWETVTLETMNGYVEEGSLFDTKGSVDEELLGGEFYVIEDELAKTKLNGKFIVEKGGKVYYYEDGLNVGGGDKEENVYVATDEDFEWISSTWPGTYENKGGDKGYFKYVGTGQEIVEIPHVIDGVEMTSYYNMFFKTGEDVKKVISTNDNIVDMSYMFAGTLTSTLDLSEFNTTNVTNIRDMFAGAGGSVSSDGIINSSYIEKIIGIENWNLSSLENLVNVFQYSNIENVPDIVKSWGDNGYLDNVTSYQGLFQTGGHKGTLDINSIFENVDTSNVTDMSWMLNHNQATEVIFGDNFNTSNVTSMWNMFNGSKAEELDLSSFDTSNVTNMNSMFSNSQATTLDLSSFNTSKVTNMNSMFRNSKATELDLSLFDTSNVKHMGSMFMGSQATELDLSSFDTSSVTSMDYMFYNSKATTLDLSSFDTSNVTYMWHMFNGSQATSLDLSSFDTSNVTDMYAMFRDSQATELDLSSFDTSNVTNMSEMFQDSKASTITFSNKFDTFNVEYMSHMFNGSQATSLDLSSFDTSNVTNMFSMFQGSQANTLDLSSFDTSNVTDMRDMRWMFRDSKATIGYARTQEDADKFNDASSTSIPSTLTFTVKQQ